MKVAVYCSSSDNIAPKYVKAAQELGKLLADRGHTLLYGGTFMGLMGAVAKASRDNGGDRMGIVSQSIYEMEDVILDTHNMELVPNLQIRKSRLAELADVHIALAGGFGTLDEISGVLAMKQVNELDAEIVLVNTDNFYQKAMELFEHYYQEGFAPHSFKKAYKIVNTVSELEAFL